MFNLIRHRSLFLGISGVLVLMSVAVLAVFGLTPGTDLAGGTRWQVFFPDGAPAEAAVMDALRAAGAEVKVTKNEEGIFTIRLPVIDEAAHAAYRTALETLGSVEEQNFSSVGPTVGAELRQKALTAIIFVLLGISLYIAWAFRKVSAPVKSWKYGVVTLVTLFHDVMIPAGLLAALGATHGIEMDTNFIVALLFVMGFSVHDTIVVFDRIRENLLRAAGREEFGEVVNRSVRETFARSLNTSVTLILVLAAMMAVGPAPLFYFTLTILVGTVVGTYSSIFVASPLLYLLGRRKD